MRQILSLNRKWAFSKEACAVPAKMPGNWCWVNLPHSWNAIDGQDGDSDYYRGTCYYAKELDKLNLPKAGRYYLEIRGAASSADVFLNGENLAHHDGGFSTWRVDLTDKLTDKSLLVIAVDNAPNDRVYPQMADFTFYGGIYRDVNLICVEDTHFELDYFGTPGIKVTPVVNGKNADVEVETWSNAAAPSVRYTVTDGEGNEVAMVTGGHKVNFTIENCRLWNGKKDPHLYTVKAELMDGKAVLDTVSTHFGCRFFRIDPEKGFFLNGESCPLRGVSRHQDRWGLGNALLPEHHEEDIKYILEMGANTIRLAHYQHDQYFYDLCDKYGLVIWAEIPYISQHMPTGRENTISQMKELVIQNYNHPSICVWGLSNEITMKGAGDPDLIENHRILNDLVHELDSTRLTTLAAISNCPIDAEYLRIPDVISYNHYFGWYGGNAADNGPWFDNFHKLYPEICVGVSEYGCEALNWHTSDPRQGDYTEEYQAYYHEELIKQLFTRPYIWATHVWNMYDFGADTRNEGGENGQNHKGLMTFDRKYKKDSFYAYKAWLSDDPFVHICGKRYVDRVEDVTKVTVYSNLPEVELFANGVSLGKKTAEDHFFRFEVPSVGETKLVAVAGGFRDQSVIRKVDTFNNDYRMKETGAILNWFDITEPEGFLSLNSSLGEIMATTAGMQLFSGIMSAMAGGSNAADGMASPEMMKMLNSFTLIRLLNMAGGMMPNKPTKEMLLGLNAQLNKIAKV